MDQDDPKQSVPSNPEAKENVHRTDVIKKTSFTIPSMSGFWKPHPSQAELPPQVPTVPLPELPPQAPTVPELPQVVPTQEENGPLPPMPVIWPAWGWPDSERADVSYMSRVTGAAYPTQPLFARSSGVSHVQKTSVFARRKPLLAIIIILILLALLIPVAIKYAANNSVTVAGTKPVGGQNGVHKASTGRVDGMTPVNTSGNGGNSSSSTVNGTGPNTSKFKVGTHPLIVLKGHESNVNIHVGSTSTMVVVARQHGNNSGIPEVLYNQVHDKQGHDRINIAAHPGYMNVDYDVTVPGTAQVEVEVDSGSVAIDGVSGVTINTGGGNLDIEDVNGLVNAYTENGDITAQNLKGSMQMEVGNGGSIRLNNINGLLTALSHNGDVAVQEAVLSGESILQTNYGSVYFDGSMDAQGTYTMKTINGNINLTLPTNAAFQLEASTGSGSIYNGFGSSMVGIAPRTQIVASIANGSVTVNKAL